MVFRRSLLLLIALLLPTIAFATTTYVVKKGDNLYDLSRKFGVSVEDIKSLNKLNNNNLGIGNELLIPDNNSQRNINYVVKSGDTISQIADKHGIKTKDLKSANNLKTDRLQIGQELFIPVKNNKETGEPASIAKIEKPLPQEKTTVKTKSKFEKNLGSYVVTKGDTLGHIAENHSIRTSELKKANNLKNNNLQIGQKLVIPNLVVEKQTTEVEQAATKPTAESTTTKQYNQAADLTVTNTYVVKKGDTIYGLSNKFKISKDNLTKWNNLNKSNLSIGQELYLTPNKEIKTASNKSNQKVSKPKYSGDYKVKSGDTLGHIASKHKISVKDLKTANDLTSNNLKIGKVLKVPSIKTAAKSTKSKVRTTVTKYKVKKGDTLGGIANRHGVTISKIKQASSLRSNKIKVGDVLLIPGNHKIPKENVEGSKYTVLNGDTLSQIAAKYAVSIKDLRKANGLSSNYLYSGMKLVIPGKAIITTESLKETKKASHKINTKYVVKKGDTLGLIAKRNGISATTIKNANNLKNDTIRQGQILVLPHSTTDYRAASSASKLPAGQRTAKQRIIETAKQYLGAPYKFGGYSFKTGIDCSGYVKKIFSKFNVELPRTARDIYYNSGIRVAKSQLQTGDLVFFRTYASFPSHVGIYMGNGKFIHASSGARKVSITNLNKKYYTKRYIGAKRIKLSAIFEKEYSQR